MVKMINLKSAYAVLWMVTATLMIGGCSKEEKVQPEIIRPVRYEKVVMTQGERTRTFTGISKAAREAKLSFRVGGKVLAVNVKNGDRIDKGHLMASLDDSDAMLQYEQLQVSLKKSRIQKDTAKSSRDRIKGLYENNNVSLSEYEQAKDKYASALSAYTADKRSLDLKKKELGYYHLYSPMKGIVADKSVEKNENIQAGQVVVILNAEKGIKVTVGMPETYIAHVKTGETVHIGFASISNRTFTGTVSEVPYAVGSQSSTYPVTLLIEGDTRAIRPGMPADVTFDFFSNESRGKLMAPSSAVGRDNNGTFVFLVKAATEGFARVHKTNVTVGRLENKGFEILDGLKEGDLVVTAGVSKLTDGLKVRMLNTP